jgi:hypothetical protein
MAIYHLSAKLISRKDGRSSTAAAAYRAGERIVDERTGEIHDYTQKRGIDHAELVMPSSAGDWRPTRAELWNAVERKNKRADAQVAREFELALPIELSAAERQQLAVTFAREVADRYGVAADVAIHHQDGENPHAHILTSTNRIEGQQLGNKARELDLVAHNMGGKIGQKNEVDHLRESWERHVNLALEKAGHTARIDHRTLEAQGIERIPQIHIGAKVAEMEARGVETERGKVALDVEAANAEICRIRAGERIGYEHHHEVAASPEPGASRGGDRAVGTGAGIAGGRNYRSTDPVAGVQPGTGGDLEQGPAGSGRGMETGGHGDQQGSEAGRGGYGEAGERGHRPDVADVLAMHEHVATVCDARQRVVALAGSTARGQEHARSGSSGENPETGHHRGIERPQEMKPDRTYLAVRRQLEAMGGGQWEIGIRDRDGRMMTRSWTTPETLKAVPWLKRQNALGADIYVRPASPDGRNTGLVLLDDIDRGTVERMKADGMEPAAVIETSPTNHQAWVRVSELPLQPEEATIASKYLAKTYGGDPNSADWRHFGRLAGFTNRKPEHAGEIGFPWVLAHECPGKASKTAYKLISLVREYLTKGEAEKEAQRRLKALREARPENWLHLPL